MKRLFSFFLAMVMLFSAMPMTAFSTGTEEPDAPEAVAETAEAPEEEAEVHAASNEGSYQGITWHFGDGTLVLGGTGVIPYNISVFWDFDSFSVKTIRIGEGITGIQEYTFENYSQIQSLHLPDTLEYIERKAFVTLGLEELHIPASLKQIAPLAFNADGYAFSTPGTRITVDPANTWFAARDGVLFTADYSRLVYCPYLNQTEYKIPEGTTALTESAFPNTGLSSVIIPEGVAEIPSSCFAAGIRTLTIPVSVTRFGSMPFGSSTEIYYGGSEAQWKQIEGAGSISGNVIHFTDAGPVRYPITVDTSASMGPGELILTNSAGEQIDSAAAGETVTMTGTREIVSISVSGVSRTEIDDRTFVFVMPANPVTVYVRFAAQVILPDPDPDTDSYVIGFDKNNPYAQGSMPVMNGMIGDGAVIPDCSYRQTDGSFVSWNTKPDGTGISVVPGTNINTIVSEDVPEVTLYAVWRFKVVYTGMPAGASNPNPDWFVSTTGIPALQPAAADGYSFSGWYNAKGICVTSIPARTFSNVILDASFSPKTYKLTLNALGGTISKSSFTFTATQEVALPRPVRDGCTFSHWQVADGTKYTAKLPKGITKDITLTAVYTPHRYTIVLNNNGVLPSNSMIIENPVDYDAVVTLPQLTASREGLFHDGWNTAANYSGRRLTNEVRGLVKEDGGRITLYAVWKYRINVVADPINDNFCSTVTACWDNSFPLSTLVKARPGYTLKGFADNEDDALKGKVKPILAAGNIVKNLTPGMTLWAVWTPNQISITYNANTGVRKPEIETKIQKTGDKLDTNSFTNGTQIFVGWNTQADGKGTSYMPGTDVSVFTAFDTKAITLYAAWIYNTEYEIHFVNGGGFGKMNDCVVKCGNALPTCKFTKAEHAFAGWAVSSSDQILPDGAVVEPNILGENKKVTLTATWRYTAAEEYEAYQAKVKSIDNSRLQPREQLYKIVTRTKNENGVDVKYSVYYGICQLSAWNTLVGRRAALEGDYTKNDPKAVDMEILTAVDADNKNGKIRTFYYSGKKVQITELNSKKEQVVKEYKIISDTPGNTTDTKQLRTGYNRLDTTSKSIIPFKHTINGTETALTLTRESTTVTEAQLIKLLMNHPEGVNLYLKKGGSEHNVVITHFVEESGFTEKDVSKRKFIYYVIDPVQIMQKPTDVAPKEFKDCYIFSMVNDKLTKAEQKKFDPTYALSYFLNNGTASKVHFTTLEPTS